MTSRFVLRIVGLLFFSHFTATSQTIKQKALTDSLSKYWLVDSVEIKDIKKLFAPPSNIKGNFLFFKSDGTFTSQDHGIVIKGKWKIDLDQRQIINYEIDNTELKGNILFNIIQLTENRLAISSNPMSGNQVILHYINRQYP